MKAADYGIKTNSVASFVSTNSICQGEQVPVLWPLVFKTGHEIAFAHTSFKWANLASHNAGVTVVIVGISRHAGKVRRLFSMESQTSTLVKETDNINAYLVPGPNIEIEPRARPLSDLAIMQFGNHPYYGGALIFSKIDAQAMCSKSPETSKFIRPLYGSKEFITASPRACLWINEGDASEAMQIPQIASKIADVVLARKAARQDKAAQKLAQTPYRFRDQVVPKDHVGEADHRSGRRTVIC